MSAKATVQGQAQVTMQLPTQPRPMQATSAWLKRTPQVALGTLLSLGFLLSVSTASAQSSATKPAAAGNDATSKAALPKTGNDRKDIDEEISNPGMRAQTGSKKVLSVQTAFSFVGSSIETPFASQRPQLSPGQVPPDVTKITGSVSMKYRMTDYDNLNVGIGLGWISPGAEGQRGQMENPFVSYGRVFQAWGLQHSFGTSVTMYTAEQQVNLNKLAYEGSIGHTAMKQFGRLFTGGSLVWSRQFYSDSAASGLLDTYGFFPFVEYSISERFQFRTVYRGFTYYDTRARRGSFELDDPTQSTGIGIIVSRDIYLYPNIQWVWEDIRGDKTNIALNANVNF